MAKSISSGFALAVLVAGMGLASSAHADWTFNSASTASNSSSAPDVTSVSGAYVVNNASNGLNSGAAWVVNASSALASYPGLGMCSDGCTAPNHAIDNLGNTEAVLLGFSGSVTLSSIGLSYATDAAGTSGPVDLSLFRYVGTGAPTINGTVATTMTGWELVGNYGDMVQDTTNPYNLVNSSGKGSSWWLISAYNSGFTGAQESRGSLDNGNDYFKISALAGYACTTAGPNCNTTTTQVAEPGSLALAGLALFGAYAVRRRSTAPALVAAA